MPCVFGSFYLQTSSSCCQDLTFLPNHQIKYQLFMMKVTLKCTVIFSVIWGYLSKWAFRLVKINIQCWNVLIQIHDILFAVCSWYGSKFTAASFKSWHGCGVRLFLICKSKCLSFCRFATIAWQCFQQMSQLRCSVWDASPCCTECHGAGFRTHNAHCLTSAATLWITNHNPGNRRNSGPCSHLG